MLRKASHIIIALLFMLTTTSMTISKHYCGTSLKSVSILLAPEHCCDIPSGCCHDKFITINIEDDFSVTASTFDFTLLELDLPPLTDILKLGTTKNTSYFRIYNTPSPPRIQEVLSRLQTYLL